MRIGRGTERKTEFEVKLMNVFEKIFGTYSDREIKRVVPIAKKVMTYDEAYTKLSDAELRAKTDEFKAGSRRAKRWTIFCRRRLLRCARPRGAYSV